MFPCFFKFKGGKGVAAAAMVILMLDLLNPLHNHVPFVFIACFATFAIIVIGTKYVSLASIMGMILYPIVYTAFNASGFASLITVLMALLVVWAHRSNIKRLKDGKESKLSFGKKKAKTVEETAALSSTPVSLDIPTASAQEEPTPAKKKAPPVFVVEQPETFTYEDDGKHEFVTCTGCGHLIPKSREICLYCKTQNAQYTPDPESEETGKKSKKKSKK